MSQNEKKIHRTINGALYNNGHWRIRYNYDLLTLYEDVDIVTLMKVKRPKRIGPINQLDDTRKAKQIFNSLLEGVRTGERPKSRW